MRSYQALSSCFGSSFFGSVAVAVSAAVGVEAVSIGTVAGAGTSVSGVTAVLEGTAAGPVGTAEDAPSGAPVFMVEGVVEEGVADGMGRLEGADDAGLAEPVVPVVPAAASIALDDGDALTDDAGAVFEVGAGRLFVVVESTAEEGSPANATPALSMQRAANPRRDPVKGRPRRTESDMQGSCGGAGPGCGNDEAKAPSFTKPVHRDGRKALNRNRVTRRLHSVSTM